MSLDRLPAEILQRVYPRLGDAARAALRRTARAFRGALDRAQHSIKVTTGDAAPVADRLRAVLAAMPGLQELVVKFDLADVVAATDEALALLARVARVSLVGVEHTSWLRAGALNVHINLPDDVAQVARIRAALEALPASTNSVDITAFSVPSLAAVVGDWTRGRTVEIGLRVFVDAPLAALPPAPGATVSVEMVGDVGSTTTPVARLRDLGPNVDVLVLDTCSESQYEAFLEDSPGLRASLPRLQAVHVYGDGPQDYDVLHPVLDDTAGTGIKVVVQRPVHLGGDGGLVRLVRARRADVQLVYLNRLDYVTARLVGAPLPGGIPTVSRGAFCTSIPHFTERVDDLAAMSVPQLKAWYFKHHFDM